MMKKTFGLFPVLVSTLLLTWFFYQRVGGLNLLIYDVLFVVWLLVTGQPLLKTSLQKWVLAGFTATSLATVFVHSDFSYVMHYLLFFIMIGLLVWPSFKSLLSALLQGFVNFFYAQWSFLKKLMVVRLRDKSLGYYTRRASLFLIPLVVVIIFFSIYRNSNPIFERWFGKTGEWIAEMVSMFFKYLDTPLFATVFWSFVFSNFLLFRRTNDSITDTDASQTDQAVRNRQRGLLGFSPVSLKNELRVAEYMLIALNVLLLVMNISDIKLVWFGFEWEGQYLKQFVHEGTYLLIFSILISVGIVLYFFRGNLNFYKKNRVLCRLSYIWLAQNAFLALSVGMRNYWYISYYALAYKRIGVLIFLILTIYGLYTVYSKVSHKKTAAYLFRQNFHALLLVVSLASLVNWDSLIARYNFSHAGKSFVHFDFLSQLSDHTLPLLDKPLHELKQIQASQQSYTAERHDIRPEQYYDAIQERKKTFLENWEQKDLFEWNWPEHKAAVRLKKLP